MARDYPMMPLIPHAIPHAVVIGIGSLPNAGMLNAHLFDSSVLPMGTASWCVSFLDIVLLWMLVIWSRRVGWLGVVWPLPMGAISCFVQRLGTVRQRPIGVIVWLIRLLEMVTLGGLDWQVWRVAGHTFHGSILRHKIIPLLTIPLIARILPIPLTQLIARARLSLWPTAIHEPNNAQVPLWRAPWCSEGDPSDGFPGGLPIWC